MSAKNIGDAVSDWVRAFLDAGFDLASEAVTWSGCLTPCLRARHGYRKITVRFYNYRVISVWGDDDRHDPLFPDGGRHASVDFTSSEEAAAWLKDGLK